MPMDERIYLDADGDVLLSPSEVLNGSFSVEQVKFGSSHGVSEQVCYCMLSPCI